MSATKIRQPFAASFAVLVLLSAYLGLSTQKIPQYGHSDKGLHFITFFLLTLTFYWIFEISRRRALHLSLLVCTAGLGVGSELLQGLLPNDRNFDVFDILANAVGSGLALALCSWYHTRMIERKRKNRHYDIVSGEEPDMELGEGGYDQHEQEASRSMELADTPKETDVDVTNELDNWDENAEDWDDDTTSAPDSGVQGKKRTD
ncbi:hypothetical protein K470DRAFT_300238 [Piedraia hortae CBS 480.64]|uniref:VanZ-like domain-containing protein n=1 Tax=Piedraia hortae CBS 480.64 TaxID=1314780 RepID=A0A6A7BYJ8_9PEZI|nr:hypothetical protein K470DRAFT_300238 [Piedraia hortae CBS 480.64]